MRSRPLTALIGLRYEDARVFQVQLARRNDAVPLTRGYIAKGEAHLAAREAALTGTPAMADA